MGNRPHSTQAYDAATHANINKTSRARKAAKIAAILERRRSLVDANLLDVGCGSGDLLRSLKPHIGAGEAHGVDVSEPASGTEGFIFKQVSSPRLPYADATFDVALSNHVIEHVGPPPAQQQHIEELFRVLKPGGLAYLAFPSRYAVMEPHYRIPFLSWLPRAAADRIMRHKGYGDEYDCYPPTCSETAKLLHQAGFIVTDCTAEAAHIFITSEGSRLARRALDILPAGAFRLIAHLPMMPTRVLILEKPSA